MAFLRCEVWFGLAFTLFFSNHNIFLSSALLGVSFGMQEKGHWGWAGGISASAVGEANDFLLDRIVENERESKKQRWVGVLPRLYCSQCQKIIASCEPAPPAEGSVD